MTKAKAFLIGFIIPSAIILGINLVFHNDAGQNWGALGRLVFYVLIVPLSFFVPSNLISVEYRRYGFYGSLICAILVGIIVLGFTGGKI